MPVSTEMGDRHSHKHEYVFANLCGADVCMDCNDHKGLARCLCGWAMDGGNGYIQLEEMGEQIESDY